MYAILRVFFILFILVALYCCSVLIISARLRVREMKRKRKKDLFIECQVMFAIHCAKDTNEAVTSTEFHNMNACSLHYRTHTHTFIAVSNPGNVSGMR